MVTKPFGQVLAYLPTIVRGSTVLLVEQVAMQCHGNFLLHLLHKVTQQLQVCGTAELSIDEERSYDVFTKYASPHI